MNCFNIVVFFVSLHSNFYYDPFRLNPNLPKIAEFADAC